MSINTKIIIVFLVFGITWGILDSIFFYIPLIWLPLWIITIYQQTDTLFKDLITYWIFFFIVYASIGLILSTLILYGIATYCIFQK